MGLVEFLLLAPVILVALVVHEYWHARAAYLLGDPTAAEQGRMTLNPLRHLDPVGTILLFVAKVGWARPVPVSIARLRHGYVDFGLVAAAGPLSNLGLATLSAALFYVVKPMVGIQVDVTGHTAVAADGLSALVAMLLFWSVLINLNLAFFNLLPVPPLDGSNILRAFLPPRAAWSFGRWSRWGAIGIVLLVVGGSYAPVHPLFWFLSMTSGPMCDLLIGVNPFA